MPKRPWTEGYDEQRIKFYAEIARKMKQYRELAELTQEEVAERVGLSGRQLMRYESESPDSGKPPVTRDVYFLHLIGEVLGRDLRDFLPTNEPQK